MGAGLTSVAVARLAATSKQDLNEVCVAQAAMSTAHKLTASPVTAEDWTPADFASLLATIASSGAQVLPVSEALAQVG